MTDSEWERSVMPDMAAAAATAATADGLGDGDAATQPSGSNGDGTFAQHARHVHVQPFAGDRKPGVYKEWRKDVRITALAYKVPDDQMASLV